MFGSYLELPFLASFERKHEICLKKNDYTMYYETVVKMQPVQLNVCVEFLCTLLVFMMQSIHSSVCYLISWYVVSWCCDAMTALHSIPVNVNVYALPHSATALSLTLRDFIRLSVNHQHLMIIYCCMRGQRVYL